MRKTKCLCVCTHSIEPSQLSSKRWNADFSKKLHRARRDPLFVDYLERTDVQRGIQSAFLQDSEISGASWEAEQVQNFFQEAGAIPDAKLWINICVRDRAYDSCRSVWVASSQVAEIMARQVCSYLLAMGLTRS